MTLYLISTPIGNLEDITLRALRLLKEVELVLAEDTRHSGKLLAHFEIKNKLESFNDKNKEKKTDSIIELLKQGKEIALVSDSGTPGISDPGFYLVRECVRNNIDVVPVPGASAFITALVASGLPTDKFSFYGFLPKKAKKKRDFFESIKEKEETIIVYESPYRIVKTLQIIDEILPQHQIVIARELTKKFEEFVRGRAKDIIENFKADKVKGEFVVLIHS